MDDKGKLVAITSAGIAITLVVLSAMLMILLMLWAIMGIIHQF